MKQEVTYISIDLGSKYTDCFGTFWVFRGNRVSSRGYIKSWNRYQRLINLQMEFFGRKLENAK